MKKLLLLLVAGFFVASCALQPGSGSGSLKVAVPTLSQSKGQTATPVIARITLSQNGLPVRVSGNETTLDAVQGTTLELKSLIPGANYRLGVSLGTMEGAILNVTNYAESDEFLVTAGGTTELNLTLSAGSAFTFLTTSGQRSSAANVGGTIYLQDGETVGTFDPSYLSITSTTVAPVPLGAEILSLSQGYNKGGQGSLEPELWINTTKGIYHALMGDMKVLIKINGIVQQPVVKYSKAIVIETDHYSGGTFQVTPSTLLAMFNTGGLYVGGIIAPLLNITDTPDPTDLLNFDNIMNNRWTSISDIISGTPDIVRLANSIRNDVVTDIAVNTDNNNNGVIYASTALGTLVVSGAMRSALSMAENTANAQVPMDYVGFYQKYLLNVGTGSGAPTIRCIASTGDKIFAGTDNGLYVADMVPIGMQTPNELYGTAKPADFSLVHGTQGEKFVALDAINDPSSSDLHVVCVAVTKSGRVFVIDLDLDLDLALAVKSPIPAAAGVPKNAKPLLFRIPNGPVYLLLTGENGAVIHDPKISFVSVS